MQPLFGVQEAKAKRLVWKVMAGTGGPGHHCWQDYHWVFCAALGCRPSAQTSARRVRTSPQVVVEGHRRYLREKEWTT